MATLTITGRVVKSKPGADNNEPVAGITVEAWDGDKTNPDDFLEQAVTSDDGRFTITVTQTRWRDDESTRKPNDLPDLVYRLYRGNMPLEILTQNIAVKVVSAQGKWDKNNTFVGDDILIDMPTVAQGGQQQAGDDVRAYLTYAPTAAESGGRSRERASEVEMVVDYALRDILGKRIRPTDGKSLLVALDRVITFDVVDGHRVTEWRPPTAAVETELGSRLTGAQASLYSFAEKSASELRARMEMLQPQGTDIDDDLVNGTRSSVLAELDDLLAALGAERLRSLRIDGSIRRLEIYLKQVKEAFGFDDQNNFQTIDDEQGYTDYLIVQQYLGGIKAAWEKFRNDPDNTLGATLAALELLFTVSREGVQEIYDAMEAISFTPTERRAYVLWRGQKDEMTVSEYFRWVEACVGEKAERLLKDGGRNALPVLTGEIEELGRLAVKLGTTSFHSTSPLSYPRVKARVTDLADNLFEIRETLKRWGRAG